MAFSPFVYPLYASLMSMLAINMHEQVTRSAMERAILSWDEGDMTHHRQICNAITPLRVLLFIWDSYYRYTKIYNIVSTKLLYAATASHPPRSISPFPPPPAPHLLYLPFPPPSPFLSLSLSLFTPLPLPHTLCSWSICTNSACSLFCSSDSVKE